MKSISILFLALTMGLKIHAQSLKRQTLSSAGNSQIVQNDAGSYYLLQSIGQSSIIKTFEVNETKLRQGFIQPLPAIVLGGDPNDLELVVYPNPFINGVTVNLENGLDATIEVQLFDITGRLLLRNSFEEDTQLSIPLLNISQGSYFLRLQAGRQQRTTKLLKL